MKFQVQHEPLSSWMYFAHQNSILIKLYVTHQYICKSDWRIWSATSLCHQRFSVCTVLPRVCCRLEQPSSFLSPTESRTHWQDLSPERGSTAWTGSPQLCSTLEETEPLQAQARGVNKGGQDPVHSSYFMFVSSCQWWQITHQLSAVKRSISSPRRVWNLSLLRSTVVYLQIRFSDSFNVCGNNT